MSLNKNRTCYECDKHLVCSIYKGVRSHIDVGLQIGVINAFEGKSPLVQTDIYKALAGACLFFTKIDWRKK